jgi:hypothetical protein
VVISAHDSCEEAGGSSDLPVTKIDSPSPYVFIGDKREGGHGSTKVPGLAFLA